MIKSCSIRSAVLQASAAILLGACGVAPPAHIGEGVSPRQKQYNVTAGEYKVLVDQRVLAANRSSVSSDHLQAMLRSVVVVAFSIDRAGRLLSASVYRTNGDDEVERTALASLRRAVPLPVPPAALLDSNGQVQLMESWLFNSDGRFQLRTLETSPQ
jgi:protein TonB